MPAYARGQIREALEIDRHVLADRSRILGPSDPRTLSSHLAVARDLRGLGLYQESLDAARKVHGMFEAAGGREHPTSLLAGTGFAVALRKAGHHWDALQEGERVLRRGRQGSRRTAARRHTPAVRALAVGHQARHQDVRGTAAVMQRT